MASDRGILYAACFLRAVATGQIGVLLGLYLAPLGLGTARIGLVITLGLVEMDVPTRQSYVMAVVRPEERTFASGVTHLVRLGGWAAGPVFAGTLMQVLALGSPLLLGAGMKITYDLLLWRAFRNVRPPEEQEPESRPGGGKRS